VFLPARRFFFEVPLLGATSALLPGLFVFGGTRGFFSAAFLANQARLSPLAPFHTSFLRRLAMIFLWNLGQFSWYRGTFGLVPLPFLLLLILLFGELLAWRRSIGPLPNSYAHRYRIATAPLFFFFAERVFLFSCGSPPISPPSRKTREFSQNPFSSPGKPGSFPPLYECHPPVFFSFFWTTAFFQPVNGVFPSGSRNLPPFSTARNPLLVPSPFPPTTSIEASLFSCAGIVGREVFFDSFSWKLFFPFFSVSENKPFFFMAGGGTPPLAAPKAWQVLTATLHPPRTVDFLPPPLDKIEIRPLAPRSWRCPPFPSVTTGKVRPSTVSLPPLEVDSFRPKGGPSLSCLRKKLPNFPLFLNGTLPSRVAQFPISRKARGLFYNNCSFPPTKPLLRAARCPRANFFPLLKEVWKTLTPGFPFLAHQRRSSLFFTQVGRSIPVACSFLGPAPPGRKRGRTLFFFFFLQQR